MNRTATVAVGAVIVVTAVTGLVLVNNSKKPPANSSSSQSSSQSHDMSTMNNQPDQDVGGMVDLTNQNEITMNIKDFKYEKPNIRIKKGTKVTWINQDTIQHNVMLEHEGSDKAHDAPTKEEVDPNELAGPLLTKGESYSFTFNEVKANPYHCSPHPFMKGSVTVVE